MLIDIPPSLLKEIATLPPGIAMPGIEAVMRAWHPEEMITFSDQEIECPGPEPSQGSSGQLAVHPMTIKSGLSPCPIFFLKLEISHHEPHPHQ
jgi:hypothetical protein